MRDQFAVLPLLNQHTDAAIGYGVSGIVGVVELEPDIAIINPEVTAVYIQLPGRDRQPLNGTGLCVKNASDGQKTISVR